MFEEKYKKGPLKYPTEVINYVVYKKQGEPGMDEVLQHKWIFYNGTSKEPSETESSHITLHPDGQVNFRMKRSKKDLEEAIKNNLRDCQPALSYRVRNFIDKVSDKL